MSRDGPESPGDRLSSWRLRVFRAPPPPLPARQPSLLMWVACCVRRRGSQPPTLAPRGAELARGGGCQAAGLACSVLNNATLPLQMKMASEVLSSSLIWDTAEHIPAEAGLPVEDQDLEHWSSWNLQGSSVSSFCDAMPQYLVFASDRKQSLMETLLYQFRC
uniref:Uncharacterized protein n=1 Tax=Arundo donax TaxID=35708 RepID=A0A0A9EAM6_ARUDO